MELAKAMKELVEFVEVGLTQGATHWHVCRLTSERFELWDDDRFPLWLSFLVLGQMREMGIEPDAG